MEPGKPVSVYACLARYVAAVITDAQILGVMPDHAVTLGYLRERLPKHLNLARLLKVPGVHRCGVGYARAEVRARMFNAAINSINEVRT